MINKLQDLVIANLNNKITYMAKHIDGMNVKETPDFVCVNCSLPTYNFNIMMLTRNDTHKIQNDTDRSKSFQSTPFSNEHLVLAT